MTELTMAFGYYPKQLNLSVGSILVSPRPELAELVARVERSERVKDDWIYAPTQTLVKPDGTEILQPYPDRIFGLPQTHSFKHSSADSDEHIAFHLWCLSFFTGMRLTSTDAGFVDCTPIIPNKLFDFLLVGSKTKDAVRLAEVFWLNNRSSPERAKLIAAIIHALFLSQNPRHLQFERFAMLYSSIDACFALAKSFNGRIKWMCELFGIPLPSWAIKGDTAAAEIVDIRNQSTHEALFMGQPLGFALHGVGGSINLTLEMEGLICRLLVGLLSPQPVDYVSTPVDTYQQYGLKLPD
jgi:hypothetical protein